MSKKDSSELVPSGDGKLSSIISNKAQIALPDIVSIFISQYETKLYEKKHDLQDAIADISKEISDHEKEVADNMKYSEFINVKIPKLGMISGLVDGPEVSWHSEAIGVQIGIFKSEDDEKHRAPLFKRTYRKPIPKADLNKHEKQLEKLQVFKDELSKTLSNITDMSRKERQVKARISEQRLQEQGLESFLQDKEMLKLIAVD